MFDLHVPAEVPLQVKLTGAVRTLEGLVAGMEMHVAQQVVHSVKGLATHLEKKKRQKYTDEHRRGLGRAPVVLFHTREICLLHPPTLHLNGFTGKWTIMCVLRVCFWMKLLKQT